MRVTDRDLRCFAEKCLDVVASVEARKSRDLVLRSDEKQEILQTHSHLCLEPVSTGQLQDRSPNQLSDAKDYSMKL